MPYCILKITAHLVYPKDTAVSRAFLLLTPARQVNTIFWDCDGMTEASSGVSWRAPFTCPTAEEKVQHCNLYDVSLNKQYTD